jgi:acyl-CoA reductase-like NAD-dependent aldehyde dehydrogenase
MVEVQSACPEDVVKALEAASEAQPAWRSSPRSDKLRSLGRLLREFKADISEVILFSKSHPLSEDCPGAYLVKTLDSSRSASSVDSELITSATILDNTARLCESTMNDAAFCSELVIHQEVCMAEGTPSKWPNLIGIC